MFFLFEFRPGSYVPFLHYHREGHTAILNLLSIESLTINFLSLIDLKLQYDLHCANDSANKQTRLRDDSSK